MTNKMDPVEAVLWRLEYELACDFAERVQAILRRLNNRQINELFLMTHTGPNMGDPVHRWRALLMPLIEYEADVRKDIETSPWLGSILAPELPSKGNANDLPF